MNDSNQFIRIRNPFLKTSTRHVSKPENKGEDFSPGQCTVAVFEKSVSGQCNPSFFNPLQNFTAAFGEGTPGSSKYILFSLPFASLRQKM